MAAPIRLTSSGSQVAPSAVPHGNQAEVGPAQPFPRAPAGPSVTRIRGMPSRSTGVVDMKSEPWQSDTFSSSVSSAASFSTRSTAATILARVEVALVQAEFDPDTLARARVDHVLSLLERAQGADLVVLPELWHVGYFDFDRYAAAAEPIHGPTVSAIAEAAAQMGAYVHAGSIVERGADGGLYN